MTEKLLEKTNRMDLTATVSTTVQEKLFDEERTFDRLLSGISVAILEPVGSHGGMHYYDRGLCNGLLAAGCHVSLYTCDETPNPNIRGLDFHPSFRSIYKQGNRILQALRYITGSFTSLKTATASGTKLCHFHAFNDLIAESVVIFMAKLFGRCLVLTVHDVDSFAGRVIGKRTITGWIYRLADRIIVHNRVSLCELEAIGIPAKRIDVIPHGHFLDCAHGAPTQAQARISLGIEQSANVILFFGQIKESKGLDVLIAALPKIASELPQVLVLIAGRPWKTDFAAYEALIEKLHMRAHCRLEIGFVPDHEVATYYAAADAVALPYRRIYQSGVLLMAMSYSRPVIVSDLPGMTEIVTDGANGFVFRNESEDDLAKVLIQALKDEQERRLSAEHAQDYIRQHHDWIQIGRATAALYRNVLAS